MSIKNIILQGISCDSHAEVLTQMFETDPIEIAIISVAFLTKSGVDHIASKLNKLENKLKILVGISNGITSYQGLTELLKHCKEFYTVDTGTEKILFHPKIYYIRNEKSIKLLIGSANLTKGGLFNNVEASVYIDISSSEVEYKELKEKIETGISEIINTNPNNFKKINTQTEINTLFSQRLLKDESTTTPRTSTISDTNQKEVIRPSTITLKTTPQPEPTFFIPTPKANKKTSSIKLNEHALFEFTPVWRSKELTERDLNIPKGKNTHPTGSINLDKGIAPADIDHRTYFKTTVFNNLSWTPKNKKPHLLEATATFGIIIKGIYHGEFQLTISHNTNTESQTYIQKNAMTNLKWGDVKPLIANPKLLSCILTLSICAQDSKRYLITID